MGQAKHNLRAILAKAMSLHQQGDSAGAEAMYHDVLSIDPNEPNALHLIGVLAWQRDDLDLAEEFVRRAITIHDQAAIYYSNLGGIMRQKGDLPDSIRQYEMALQIDPSHDVARKELGQSLHRYGLALTGQHRWEDVKVLYNRILELEPNNTATLNNLAGILQHQNNRSQALAYYSQAIRAEPENLLVRYNRGICYLTEQRLPEGWSDFIGTESYWRAMQDKRINLPWINHPLWRGEDLQDKKILLWGDQGIGDEIVYASMVPELIERGAIVTLECNQRLVPLFERAFPSTSVLPRENPPLPDNDFEYQCPGLWLACQLRPVADSFSKQPSFLKADPNKISSLRQRYKVFGKKYIVGLSWFTASPAWGLARSIPLPDMLRDLDLANTLIIDMQYGNTGEAWDEAQHVFPELTVFHDPYVDQFLDMDMFAAQVAACDAVYTISNTTSHVAGALGVPAVVLMSDIGLTWYWFAAGNKSPWYPSLHLLRPGDPDRLKSAASLVYNLIDSH